MTKRPKRNKSSDEDMTKKRGSRNAEDVASRKKSNDDINTSLKGMYDDVVDEPVPDGMNNFDKPARKPEG